MAKDLNRLSAEVIMGWQLCFEVKEGHYCLPDEDSSVCKVQYLLKDWHPLTDMNQCMMVVERMRELGWNMEVFLTGQGQPQAYIKPVSAYASKDHHFYHAISETAQESLITAALKAKGVEV